MRIKFGTLLTKSFPQILYWQGLRGSLITGTIGRTTTGDQRLHDDSVTDTVATRSGLEVDVDPTLEYPVSDFMKIEKILKAHGC